jgi:hypothetical protein
VVRGDASYEGLVALEQVVGEPSHMAAYNSSGDAEEIAQAQEERILEGYAATLRAIEKCNVTHNTDTVIGKQDLVPGSVGTDNHTEQGDILDSWREVGHMADLGEIVQKVMDRKRKATQLANFGSYSQCCCRGMSFHCAWHGKMTLMQNFLFSLDPDGNCL